MIDTTQRIEPARLEALPEKVTDLVAELASSAANLGNRLHPLTAANFADVVRIMNSYYSNLIEGNNTRPRDIERALAGDLDADPARRNLQIEAGLPERSARRVLNALVEKGLLASTTPKGAVSLRFPASSLEILFPHLFPQI